MARLQDLLDDLDALLRPERFSDVSPNGLQVPHPAGPEAAVELVVTGVSADRDLLEAAATAGADLVLVHHGLFWPSVGPLDPVAAGRLRLLLAGGTALVAHHLPLDGHPEIGNNALLADALGAEHAPWEASSREHGAPIGVRARWSGGITADDLAERVRAATQRELPAAFLEGPATVHEIAVVSGAAAGLLGAAAADGLDGLLTGEPTEQTRGLARELGMHALCAGHHATETRGVRALGERLARRFGVEHRFVDTQNPI